MTDLFIIVTLAHSVLFSELIFFFVFYPHSPSFFLHSSCALELNLVLVILRRQKMQHSLPTPSEAGVRPAPAPAPAVAADTVAGDPYYYYLFIQFNICSIILLYILVQI